MKTNYSSYFSIKDYREALKLRQKELKSTLGKQFSHAMLADTIRIQRSYLSKVYALDADLSDDQLYLAIKYLKFTDQEVLYLRTLHSYQRSGLKERRLELEKQLTELRHNFLRADKHFETVTLNTEIKTNIRYQDYFLDPLAQLVHMFLTVDRYKKNHAEIIQLLHLTEKRWSDILELLIELKLIHVNQQDITVTQEHILLSKDSPLLSAHHMFAKANASTRLQTVPPHLKNSLTFVFTCNKETSEEIRVKLVEFLKAIEGDIKRDTHPTGVYQLSLDLFPWS